MDLKFSSFEWDAGNVEKNLKKHGISCEEAEEALQGGPLVYPDEKHSAPDEKRYVAFGQTDGGRFLFVAFTIRKERLRVISARPMSRKERAFYEKEKENL